MTDTLRDRLWTTITAADYQADTVDKYRQAILEQYNIYVEMADRVSARRSLTNTFFLTLNTAVFTLIGTILQLHQNESTPLLVFPLIALLGQCGAWYYLVRSYQQLNSAKYAVIGELEQRLPASPYGRLSGSPSAKATIGQSIGR